MFELSEYSVDLQYSGTNKQTRTVDAEVEMHVQILAISTKTQDGQRANLVINVHD